MSKYIRNFTSACNVCNTDKYVSHVINATTYESSNKIWWFYTTQYSGLTGFYCILHWGQYDLDLGCDTPFIFNLSHSLTRFDDLSFIVSKLRAKQGFENSSIFENTCIILNWGHVDLLLGHDTLSPWDTSSDKFWWFLAPNCPSFQLDMEKLWDKQTDTFAIPLYSLS